MSTRVKKVQAQEAFSSFEARLGVLEQKRHEAQLLSIKVRAGSITREEYRQLEKLNREVKELSTSLKSEAGHVARLDSRAKRAATAQATHRTTMAIAATAAGRGVKSTLEKSASGDEQEAAAQGDRFVQKATGAPGQAGSLATEHLRKNISARASSASLRRRLSKAVDETAYTARPIQSALSRKRELRRINVNNAAKKAQRTANIARRQWYLAKRRRAVSGQASLAGGIFGRLGAIARTPFTLMHKFTRVRVALVAGLLTAVLIPATLMMALPLISSPAMILALGGSSSTSGSMLAQIAQREYDAGMADGTFHQNDSTYWDFVFGGGFSNGKSTPWCACFVSWCANEAGLIDSGLFPKTGAVAAYISWFADTEKGQEFTDPSTYTAQVGDLLCYSSNHIGIVTRVEADGTFYTIEGNTSSPVGSSSCGEHEHAKTSSGYSGLWGSDWVFIRPAYPASSGGSIQIPAGYGGGGYTITEYDKFESKWMAGTLQKTLSQVWVGEGRPYSDHIATVKGRYLVACTTTFGNVGDMVDFYLEDGTVIQTIIADTKNPNDSGCNEWGHNNGQNVIEFEVESAYYNAHGNPGTSSWKSEWAPSRAGRVVSATNLGSIL